MGSVPPDGGYGWVICILTMFLGMLQSSTFALYGVIFLDLVEYFQVNKADVTWVGAITMLASGVGGKFELILIIITYILSAKLIKR